MSCQDIVDLRFSATSAESDKFIDALLEEGVCSYKVCRDTHIQNPCTFSNFYTITITTVYTSKPSYYLPM